MPRLTINQEDWQPKKKDVIPETTAGVAAPVDAWERTSCIEVGAW